MSRIRWTGLAQSSTSASIRTDGTSELNREHNWHVFVSGTFGGATVQIQYTPDLQEIADGSATWYAPGVLSFGSGGDTFFQAKPRKFRVAITGGDGTTSITVEIR